MNKYLYYWTWNLLSYCCYTCEWNILGTCMEASFPLSQNGVWHIPVVAELAECVVQHSRKTWAMLTRGAKAPIRSDGDVGVVVHVHLKTQPWKCHYSPKVIILEKINTETGIKRTAVRKQWKHDCLVTILSGSWTPKIWETTPAFYPLLIRFYLPSGLEVTEFRRLTTLLISVSGQNSGWTELNFRVSDWPKLRKHRIPSW
jgi:hypothetical protein